MLPPAAVGQLPIRTMWPGVATEVTKAQERSTPADPTGTPALTDQRARYGPGAFGLARQPEDPGCAVAPLTRSGVATMNERVARLVAGLDLDGPPATSLDRLCLGATAELGVAGAGLSLIVLGEHRGTLSATDDRIAVVEELQYTLGDWPCMDAHRTGSPVSEVDLGTTLRWTSFSPAALAVGVRAVFAFPLQIGSARFGAMDLYRDSPGRLSDEDHADAVSVADVATGLLLDMQAGAPPGSLPRSIDDLVDRRAVVNQAAGMVSVQLDVSIEDAHVALRARAYADDRRVVEVAADVVARRIRLGP